MRQHIICLPYQDSEKGTRDPSVLDLFFGTFVCYGETESSRLTVIQHYGRLPPDAVPISGVRYA